MGVSLIKDIKFKDGIIKYDTVTGDGFDDILNRFDRKIKTMVSSWNIPNHDNEDLAQICRIKLIEALEKYNDKLNINFSTYVYTLWHRKLGQIRYQYKTKKHSGLIENDNYVSSNYALDKNSNAFYLMLGKHKCPLSKKIIDRNTCAGCEHHVAYKSKEVSKGADAGVKKKFTLCKHGVGVLAKRGENTLSLDQPIGVSDSGEQNSLLNFISTKSLNDDMFFNIDFENLRRKGADGKRAPVDKKSFTILRLMIDGLKKGEIIEKMKITPAEFEKVMEKLINNQKIKNLVQ